MSGPGPGADQWTHPVCYPCWKGMFQLRLGQEPYALANPELVRCCFCGYRTDSGIYVRFDPRRLTCDHQSAIPDATRQTEP